MQKIIIVSGPVIVNNNKVLLDISSGDDFWKFCGGRASEKESLKETAVRRAKEELNIDVKIIKDKPFLMYAKKEKEGNAIDIILVHWLANFSGDVSTGADVKKYDWFELNNLPENIGPNIIPALKHFGFVKK